MEEKLCRMRARASRRRELVQLVQKVLPSLQKRAFTAKQVMEEVNNASAEKKLQLHEVKSVLRGELGLRYRQAPVCSTDKLPPDL